MTKPTTKAGTLEADFKRMLEKWLNDLSVQREKDGKPFLWVVDQFCESIASKLGTEIKSHQNGVISKDDIGWIWGQYRGTALSGVRQLLDYYYMPADEGFDDRQDYLLEFYWQTYGIGSTFGELFNRRVLENPGSTSGQKPGKKSRSEHNDELVLEVVWHALRVTTHRGRELQFEEWPSGDIEYCELRIPDRWVERVFSTSLLRELKASLPSNGLGAASRKNAKRGDNDDKKRKDTVQRLLDEGRFRVRLQRSAHLLSAEILERYSDQEEQSRTIQSARSFLARFDMSPDFAVETVVRAIQMFRIYLEPLGGPKTHDLVVLIPCPVGRKILPMPRIGFALAFSSRRKITRSRVEKITQFLDNTLTPRLEDIAKQWEANAVAKDSFDEKSEFLGSNYTAHLRDMVKKGLDGNDPDATQILIRILPLLKKLPPMIPKFVHEGHRFRVNIVIGLPYHEQVLGYPLAKFTPEYKVEKLQADLSEEDEIKLLKPIIDLCYSLLDSGDTVLFGQLSDKPSGTVRWNSLLKLHADAKGNNAGMEKSLTARYEALTRGHGNLFALCVDESEKLRVFSGGKILLEFSRGQWRTGASTGKLTEKLTERISSVLGLSLPKKIGNEFAAFADLVQRISETPGAGALFVLTTAEEDVQRNLLEISAPPKNIYEKPLGELLKDGSDTVFRLATMDGATVICLPKGNNGTSKHPQLRFSRASMKPRRMISEKFDLKAFSKKWPWSNWPDCLSYGSRRASALALAMCRMFDKERGPFLCIVISADGPVYFMPGLRYPVEPANIEL